MIKRAIYQTIKDNLFKGKAIVLTGARQVGKTTLLKQLLIENNSDSVMTLNCDEPDICLMLENVTSSELKNLIGNHTLVLIDEAQKVNNIGLTLKLIVDNLPDIQVVATGSSAFELRNILNEPLTGRKFEYRLYPFSTDELIKNSSAIEERRLLEQRLIFGMYPDVINQPSDKTKILRELTNSYLFKDILSYKDIRNPVSLSKLLTMLALQVGSEVSYSELSRSIGIDKETVERYLDLLEKVFVVFRLNSFSRNIRNELKKSKKVYFYDNGIRNAIINNYQPLKLRNDVGALWENFVISERLKMIDYNELYSNTYFWRTHSQQEIDYIEERDGIIHTFEIKWNENKKSTLPSSFATTYPEHTFEVITPSNYLNFLI
ncbi:MAG TPA: ATP-binding protein [Paludibacter sp.]|nr:ATP-binding protein [Paludibacter sp.]